MSSGFPLSESFAKFLSNRQTSISKCYCRFCWWAFVICYWQFYRPHCLWSSFVADLKVLPIANVGGRRREISDWKVELEGLEELWIELATEIAYVLHLKSRVIIYISGIGIQFPPCRIDFPKNKEILVQKEVRWISWRIHLWTNYFQWNTT